MHMLVILSLFTFYVFVSRGHTVYILQRGVQWKQGVLICMVLYVILLYNTTPIHCTPPPTAPPCNEYLILTIITMNNIIITINYINIIITIIITFYVFVSRGHTGRPSEPRRRLLV